MKKLSLILLLLTNYCYSQNINYISIDSILKLGKYTLAIKELKKTNTSIVKQKIGTIYLTIDNYEKAIVYLNESLSIDENYTTKLKLATCFQKTNRNNEAVNLYKEILEEQPQNLLTLYKLAKLYLKLNNTTEAIKSFNHLAHKDSLNPMYDYYIGLAYKNKKDINKKTDSFLKSYHKDTTHIKSIYRLTLCYQTLRDKDSSNLFLDKGLALAPDHINLNKLKINNLYGQQHFSEAIELLKKIDSLQPSNFYTQKMLGKSYFKNEDYETAIGKFKKALSIDPEDFKSHTYIGHCYSSLNNFKKARFSYMQSLHVGKQQRDEEHYSFGFLFLKMEKPDQAIIHFKKARIENWKNANALYQLAVTSDSYYNDKKISYKLLKEYIQKFNDYNTEYTKYATRRILEIKKDYFMKGVHLE